MNDVLRTILQMAGSIAFLLSALLVWERRKQRRQRSGRDVNELNERRRKAA